MAAREATGEFEAAEQPVERWLDQPRVDAREKVTGKARYLEDLPDLPGMAHAVALRSPYSHARILSIDSSRAESLPGVLAVLHRDRLGDFDICLNSEGTRDQDFITIDKARFDGDLVGMVVAEDLRTARRAVELIEVEYEILDPVFSPAEALAPGAPLVHEDLGTNLALTDSLAWGDIEAGFREADHVVEGTFTSGNLFQYPIEPAGSSIAYCVNDTAELWASIEKPYGVAPRIAELLGIRPDQVRVRVPYIGGGFGAKQFLPPMLASMALSRKIARPVRLMASSEESFRASARHAVVYRARLGLNSDGRLVALDVDLDVDTGAYHTAAGIVVHNACISAFGCYRIPHFRVQARAAYTNKIPAGTFRSTGKSQTTFGVECLLDKAARQLALNPIELRNQNVLLRDEYITRTWKIRGEECPADTPPMDMDYPDLLHQAVEAIHWDGSTSDRRIGSDSGRRVARGRGVALSLRHGSQGVGRTYAMATLYPDGTVKISHNAPDLGTGVYTIISVVAARTLGIPQSLIQVGMPDTSNELPFPGTNAQRTTVQMGNAVQAACEDLKRELIEAAVQGIGGTPDEWRVAEGQIWRGKESFSFADVPRAFKGSVLVKGMGSYGSPAARDRAFGAIDHWSPGAAAAEVEVDLETGEVRVLQYSALADAGKALHFLSARRQVEGGAIMGFGNALCEELQYEDGQLLNADPLQYRLPLMRDIPWAFSTSIVEHGDGPGPFGAKGMSQTSIPAAAPAIGNAICDAIGAHVESVPFTPEKILRLLGKLGTEE